MSELVIAGWSVLSSAGFGAPALAGRLAEQRLATAPVHPGVDVSPLYPQPMPAPTGHALLELDARRQLGRKGTSCYDRATTLAVLCCQQALQAAQLDLDGEPELPGALSRDRVGVVLGTSLGSFKSTSDYSRETLVQDKPYQVNPMLFPNTVMNCSAAQLAIRFGLRGVNATVAGGGLALLAALRYASNAIDRGHAEVMLTGSVEEFSPHRAWADHLTGRSGPVPTGEAAGIFALSRTAGPGWTGTRQAGRLLGVVTGFGPDGADSAEQALAGCVARLLHRAAVAGTEVRTVLTGETSRADLGEYLPATRALGHQPERLLTKQLFGDCDAASGAVALAAFLAVDFDGLGLITGRGPDGAVGAALVKGAADVGTHRR
ncbi:MAG: beta-ketoacyl synthase N-terminal-like domain-containing protein [Jatrophihabitans sp.]